MKICENAVNVKTKTSLTSLPTFSLLTDTVPPRLAGLSACTKRGSQVEALDRTEKALHRASLFVFFWNPFRILTFFKIQDSFRFLDLHLELSKCS